MSEIVLNAINSFIPLRPRKTNPRKPWLNNEVFKEIKKKRKLWHKYCNNKNEVNYSLYRIQNNKTKKCIDDARKNYEHNLLNSSDKHFYAYINRCLNSKLVNFNLVDKNTDSIIETEEQIAETFAAQFQSVFEQNSIASNIMPTLPLSTEREITSICFTPDKVQGALESLKINSSPGPGDTQAVFLSKCKQSLCNPLAAAMNDILNTGHFPEIWKTAVVIPIFKKGNKLLAANYRPISLTCTPCKCMEKIVAKELT